MIRKLVALSTAYPLYYTGLALLTVLGPLGLAIRSSTHLLVLSSKVNDWGNLQLWSKDRDV